MPAIRTNSKKPRASPSDNSSSGSVSSAKPKQPSEPCPICNTVMSRAADLGRHMRTHQQQKEFVCTYDVGNCSYASHSKTDLDIHMRRAHLKVKPFACDDCNYASADAAGLYRHRRQHHGYVPRTVRVRASTKKNDETVSNIPASVRATVQENGDEGYSQQFHRFNAGVNAGKRNEDEIDELDSSSYDSDIAPWVPQQGHYTPYPPPPPPPSGNYPLIMHMTHQESHLPHIPQPYYSDFTPKKSALSSMHYPFLPQSKVDIPTFSNAYPAEQSVPSIQGWSSVTTQDDPYAQYPVPASNDFHCNTCTTQGEFGFEQFIRYPTNSIDTLAFHSIANSTHLESLLVEGFHQLTVTSDVGSHSWEFNEFEDFSSESSSPVTIPGSVYESADNNGNPAFGQELYSNDLVLPMTFEELAAVYTSIYNDNDSNSQ